MIDVLTMYTLEDDHRFNASDVKKCFKLFIKKNLAHSAMLYNVKYSSLLSVLKLDNSA